MYRCQPIGKNTLATSTFQPTVGGFEVIITECLTVNCRRRLNAAQSNGERRRRARRVMTSVESVLPSIISSINPSAGIGVRRPRILGRRQRRRAGQGHRRMRTVQQTIRSAVTVLDVEQRGVLNRHLCRQMQAGNPQRQSRYLM
jgi:hypothetical protein